MLSPSLVSSRNAMWWVKLLSPPMLAHHAARPKRFFKLDELTSRSPGKRMPMAELAMRVSKGCACCLPTSTMADRHCYGDTGVPVTEQGMRETPRGVSALSYGLLESARVVSSIGGVKAAARQR